MATTLVHVLSDLESLNVAVSHLESILLANPRPPLRTRIGDALRDVRSAIVELGRLSPNHPLAVAFLKSAIGELEEVLTRNLLDATTSRDLLNRLTGVSWLVAKQDVEAAIGTHSPLAIALASLLINQGDTSYAQGRYEISSGFYRAATLVVAFPSHGS